LNIAEDCELHQMELLTSSAFYFSYLLVTVHFDSTLFQYDFMVAVGIAQFFGSV